MFRYHLFFQLLSHLELEHLYKIKEDYNFATIDAVANENDTSIFLRMDIYEGSNPNPDDVVYEYLFIEIEE